MIYLLATILFFVVVGFFWFQVDYIDLYEVEISLMM